jgi:hypothetical protein
MPKDTTQIDTNKHIDAMVHMLQNILNDDSKSSYCELLAIPALTEMGIEVNSKDPEKVLKRMIEYRSQFPYGGKPSFRNSRSSDGDEVVATLYKWTKEGNVYSYSNNIDTKGTVTVFPKTVDKRYKWSTDNESQFELYLYKAQKAVERSTTR